jgi:hypothetical protein
MSQIGEIPMSWVSFSSHGRWDAPFWLKVADVLAARVKGRPFTEAEVKNVVEEIEARKEFPAARCFDRYQHMWSVQNVSAGM